MRAGQALRLPRGLRPLAAVILALPLLGGLAAGALAWRLAQGPLDVPWLARQMERQFAADHGEGRLSIASARLAWEGFRDAAPLEVRVSGTTLRDDAGRVVGRLPDARIGLAIRPLLAGIVAPAEIVILGPEVALRRDESGRVALDLPGRAPAGADEAPDATPAILGDILWPGQDRPALSALRRIRVEGGHVTVRDAALGRDWRLEGARLDIRRDAGAIRADGEGILHGEAGLRVPVHLSGEARRDPVRFSVRLDLPALRPPEVARLLPEAEALGALDAPLAISATAELDGEGTPQGVTLALAAPEGGRVAGLRFDVLEARAIATGGRLDLEAARIEAGGRRLSAQGVLLRADAGWAGRVNLDVPVLEAADLARHWPPELSPLTRHDALAAFRRGRLDDVALGLDVEADGALREWRLRGGEARLRASGALLSLGEGGQVALREGQAEAAMTRDSVTLRRAELVLEPPRADSPAPRLQAEGAARLEAGTWRGRVALSLDRARIADLPVLWPAALGGNERAWITQNLTAGEARAGRWEVEAEAPAHAPAALRPTALRGELSVDAATVHWLRPIPPVTGVAATVRFGLEEIQIATRGGRQGRDTGEPGPVEFREGSLRILLPPGQVPRAEMSFALAGPVADVAAVIRHPRLNLFERRPFPVTIAAGTQEGTLSLSFPLVADLRTEQLRLRGESRVRGGRLTRALLDRDIEDIEAGLTVDTDSLRIAGTASFVGSPVRVGVEMDFRPGPGAQVVARETATGRFDARTLAALGFDAGGLLAGPVQIEARTERRRNGQGSVALRGDLRDATLSFAPLRWQKPRGSPGTAEASLRLSGETLTAIESIRVEALELSLRGRAVAPRAGRIERVEIAESVFGASRFNGEARAPAQPGGAWAVNLRGPVLDLRAVFEGTARDRAPPDPSPDGDAPPLALDLRFDRVLMGSGRDVFGLLSSARTDRNGVVREAAMRARTAPAGGAFDLAISPRGEARLLRGNAEDGGALLRALGIVSTVGGGRMTVAGQYADSRPGTALTGVAELDQFVVRDAPALGKLLQAMTLYGLVEAAQGGSGLAFARAVVPFTLAPEEVRIEDARAFSASLGVTARGRVLRERGVLDMEGTIVPAYFFNSLLGNLPVIGRLFSPEAGGGVFAATYRAQGSTDDPSISVNPLAALTPGFLRGLFGLADGRR